MDNFKPCANLPAPDMNASYNAAITENPTNSPPSSGSRRSKRAVGDYTKFWRAGRTLNIYFIDRLQPDDKMKFMKVFDTWSEHANLHFKLSTSNTAEIRIKTTTDENFSYMGTDALLIDKTKPTMLISLLPGNEHFECTLLHEIGHAIGFYHEHAHREADIPWNQPKVYEYYKKYFNWDKSDVDINIFSRANGSVVDTEYDKTSIMHYPVSKALTDGKWEVGINTELSAKDKHAANKCYPANPDDVPW